MAKDSGPTMAMMNHILRGRLKNGAGLRVDDAVDNGVFWLAYERLRPARGLYAVVNKMHERTVFLQVKR